MRDGTLEGSDFIESANQIRVQVKALLQEAADYEIGSKEKTPLAYSQKINAQPCVELSIPRVEEFG